MTNVDYILLAPIAFGAVYGAYRGLIKEAVSLVCVLIGIFVARYFGETVAAFLVKILFVEQGAAKAIGCFLVFTVVVIGLNFVAAIITKLLKIIKLNWFNRIAGMAFGGIKWLFIISIILNIISLFYEKVPVKSENKLLQSKLYKPIENSIQKVIPLLNFEGFKKKKITN
ncbi:MAG: CvpA family protein [Bacteroidales bacterium]|jgi:membrane protein required for colicin V production|nr:CvpA family protein [Bacteroidales bacterium]